MIMKTEMNMVSPWDVAYECNKEFYTRAEIDDMMMCELEELATYE